MPTQAKIAIPVALVGAIAAVLLWLSNRALDMERRVTCVEVKSDTMEENVTEIKQDIREIKRDIKLILGNRKEMGYGL
jgi:3-dehydroquinate dehydratase